MAASASGLNFENFAHQMCFLSKSGLQVPSSASFTAAPFSTAIK